MAVVERVIFRQMRAGFGQLLNRGHQGILLGSEFECFNPHFRPFRQHCPRRQNDQPIDDFSSHTHSGFLPLIPPESKLPGRLNNPVGIWDFSSAQAGEQTPDPFGLNA